MCLKLNVIIAAYEININNSKTNYLCKFAKICQLWGSAVQCRAVQTVFEIEFNFILFFKLLFYKCSGGDLVEKMCVIQHIRGCNTNTKITNQKF